MNENLMTEILKFEDEANNIIYDAKKKIRQMEIEKEKEIEKITKDLEKEFNEKVNMLKATIQREQKDEEGRLKEQFEASKKRLRQIDPKVLEGMIMLVYEEICKT
ncbi:MAG: hypothetical protein ACE5KZ_12400 [Candidatus Scalinduaceae bacterium]